MLNEVERTGGSRKQDEDKLNGNKGK